MSFFYSVVKKGQKTYEIKYVAISDPQLWIVKMT